MARRIKNCEPERLLISYPTIELELQNNYCKLLFANILEMDTKPVTGFNPVFKLDPIDKLRVIHEAIGLLFHEMGADLEVDISSERSGHRLGIMRLMGEKECPAVSDMIDGYTLERDTKSRLLAERVSLKQVFDA